MAHCTEQCSSSNEKIGVEQAIDVVKAAMFGEGFLAAREVSFSRRR
jgi:hypothetical protein